MEKEYCCRYCGVKTSKYATICSECSKKLKLVRKLKQMVENARKPDLVEVVRCNECMYCEKEVDHYCRKFLSWVEKDGYCSYGKRGRK